MDAAGKERAEVVRSILRTRDLAPSRVAAVSAECFGKPSPFFISPKFFANLAQQSGVPSLAQLAALAHITHYRLADWLAVFGVRLDAVSRVQLILKRKHTYLLNSSVHDSESWVPWFRGKPQLEKHGGIWPLVQLIGKAGMIRTRELLSLNQNKFLYARIGEEDAHAFPQFTTGSIVRARLLAHRNHFHFHVTRAEPSADFFLVRNKWGYTCSRLFFPGPSSIAFYSALSAWPEPPLDLGREADILGIVDAELRILQNGTKGSILPVYRPPIKSHSPTQTSSRSTFGAFLRAARLCQGLSFRQASAMSRAISKMLGDPRYFAAVGTLCDYETLETAPRDPHKSAMLSALYAVPFDTLLASARIASSQTGESIPEAFLPRPRAVSVRRAAPEERPQKPTEGFLGKLLDDWQEIPLFLRAALGELTGIQGFSLSDVFWVGENGPLTHPWLSTGCLIAVNRRIKRIARTSGVPDAQRPLYLLLTRESGYVCGCCSQVRDQFLFEEWFDRGRKQRPFQRDQDAEVVGQVTAILRHINTDF